MHKAVTYYPSFFLFLFSYFSIFYCKILFNPYKYYSYLPKELLWTKELLCSLVCYLFVRNVYAFFTLKKTLKRPFKAILKSFKLLLIFYWIHFTFSFFALHTLQSRMRKSYPHFHKPFKFAILRGCSSLFTYTVFLILLFLLQLITVVYLFLLIYDSSSDKSISPPVTIIAFIKLSTFPLLSSNQICSLKYLL